MNTQRPGDPPIEYQAASALAAVLRQLPDYADPDTAQWPYGVGYHDVVANMVVFTVHGVVFHAAITSA